MDGAKSAEASQLDTLEFIRSLTGDDQGVPPHRFVVEEGDDFWTPVGEILAPGDESPVLVHGGALYMLRDGKHVQVAHFVLPVRVQFHRTTVLQPRVETRLEVMPDYKHGPVWVLRDGHQQPLTVRKRDSDSAAPVYAEVTAPAIVPFRAEPEQA